MPLAVDALTKDSSAEQVRKAISESIAQCTREGGRDPDQCKAMAFSIARKNTSPDIRRGLEPD